MKKSKGFGVVELLISLGFLAYVTADDTSYKSAVAKKYHSPDAEFISSMKVDEYSAVAMSDQLTVCKTSEKDACYRVAQQ